MHVRKTVSVGVSERRSLSSQRRCSSPRFRPRKSGSKRCPDAGLSSPSGDRSRPCPTDDEADEPSFGSLGQCVYGGRRVTATRHDDWLPVRSCSRGPRSLLTTSRLFSDACGGRIGGTMPSTPTRRSSNLRRSPADLPSNLGSRRPDEQERSHQEVHADRGVSRLHLGRLADWLEPSSFAIAACDSPRLVRTSRRRRAKFSFISTSAASSGFRRRNSPALPTRHPAASRRFLFLAFMAASPCWIDRTWQRGPDRLRSWHWVWAPVFLQNTSSSTDRVGVDPVHNAPGSIPVVDTELVTTWTDRWHRPRMRH